MTAEPSLHVLQAFGLEGTTELLDGGQGETFRVGDSIVKPVDDIVVTEWMSELFSGLQFPRIRVAAPIKSTGGDWVVDGYACQSLLSGRHEWDRWDDVLAVSKRFHETLARVERPAWLDDYDDIYRRADKWAWSEGEIEVQTDLGQGLLDQLLSNRSDITTVPQLIHGDIGGNILFDESMDSAVIDFSPYWRPAAYADAIAVVDAVSWHGASVELVERMLARTNGYQLLLRAALFRIAVDAQQEAARPEVFEGHARFVNTLMRQPH